MLASALAPSSSKAYERAWKKFTDFVVKNGLPIKFPIPTNYLLWFFTDLHNKGLAYVSLLPILSAISYIQKIKHVEDTTKSFKLQQLLLAIKQNKVSGDLRQPITYSMLSSMLDKLATLPISAYENCLFKALFLLSFHFGLRLGEVTDSPHNLKRDSIFLGKNSMSLTFHSFKHGRGPPITHEVQSSNSRWCPVVAMDKFLKLRGSRPGPLFILGNSAVKRGTLNAKLKSLLQLCGIQSKITSHSFRIGAATWWAHLNYSEARIKRLGRWKSNAFLKYIRGSVVHPTA